MVSIFCSHLFNFFSVTFLWSYTKLIFFLDFIYIFCAVVIMKQAWCYHTHTYTHTHTLQEVVNISETLSQAIKSFFQDNQSYLLKGLCNHSSKTNSTIKSVWRYNHMLLENLAMTANHSSDPGYNNKKQK